MDSRRAVGIVVRVQGFARSAVLREVRNGTAHHSGVLMAQGYLGQTMPASKTGDFCSRSQQAAVLLPGFAILCRRCGPVRAEGAAASQAPWCASQSTLVWLSLFVALKNASLFLVLTSHPQLVSTKDTTDRRLFPTDHNARRLRNTGDKAICTCGCHHSQNLRRTSCVATRARCDESMKWVEALIL